MSVYYIWWAWKEAYWLQSEEDRQLRFVGHVRKGGLEKLVLEEKINGERQRGGQRLKYL